MQWHWCNPSVLTLQSFPCIFYPYIHGSGTATLGLVENGHLLSCRQSIVELCNSYKQFSYITFWINWLEVSRHLQRKVRPLQQRIQDCSHHAVAWIAHPRIPWLIKNPKCPLVLTIRLLLLGCLLIWRAKWTRDRSPMRQINIQAHNILIFFNCCVWQYLLMERWNCKQVVVKSWQIWAKVIWVRFHLFSAF